MREQTYIIRVHLPEDVDSEYFREYMREAISQWSGQFHPEDPLFGWFHYAKRLWIKYAGNKKAA